MTSSKVPAHLVAVPVGPSNQPDARVFFGLQVDWEKAVERTIEQRSMRKVYWRILPFPGLLYFICYIDRVNVGFAALTMRGDLGLSQAAFGLGAGTAFFLGYFLLEVPSNVILPAMDRREPVRKI